MVTAHSNRRTRIAGVALALLALGGFTSTQAAAVTPAIAAPAGLQVVRTGPTATTLAITWKPVTGATRYTVNVFDITGNQDPTKDLHLIYTAPMRGAHQTVERNAACAARLTADVVQKEKSIIGPVRAMAHQASMVR